MSKIRLQVALAQAGITSRRKASLLIASGHVRVNGKIIEEKGFRVDALHDRIEFNGKLVRFAEEKKYYMLNKPVGVVSTVSDERGRKTVLEYIPEMSKRLYPVGRLDKNTRGLIIVTNDGDLTYRLTHPKFEIERVYEVALKGEFTEEDRLKLIKGVFIEGKPARADKIAIKKKTKYSALIEIVLHEGKKREVRRMIETLGYEVLDLKRISYGPLALGSLKEGQSRLLTGNEIKMLKKI